MKRVAIYAGLALSLALGACHSGSKDQGAGNAEGEILPGSTSDAMIQLDTVRSQAPLAPKATASGKGEAQDAATQAADAGAGAAPATAPAQDAAKPQ